MVVDESGNFITQRKIPKMALIQPELTDSELILRYNGDEFRIALKLANETEKLVTVWNDSVGAFDEGDEVSNWLTKILDYNGKKKIRLVRINEMNLRKVDPDYLEGESAETAFSDGFPYLVANLESLKALNHKLVERGSNPVSINRFRPNIVVEGIAPFEENNIEYLEENSGKFKLAMRKPCKRCVITTIDPNTGKTAEPKEPLRTLVEDFPLGDKTGAFFAQNAVVVSGAGAKIRIGTGLRRVN